MSNEASLFILEDSKHIRLNLVELFTELPAHQRKEARIDGFRVTATENAAQAWEELETAHREGRHFDVAIFDLGVPEKPDSNKGKDSPQVGLGILGRLKKLTGLCGAIIITSAHLHDTDVLERLLRLGTVFDFKQKMFSDEEILDCAVFAYLRVQRIKFDDLMTRWRLWRAKNWFAPQLRDLAFEQMERSVAAGLFQVRGDIALIEQGLADRFQLDLERDAQDPLCVSLAKTYQGIDNIVEDCRQLMGQKNQHEREPFSKINLNKIVDECVDKFHPGIASRQIAIRWKPSAVPTHVTTIKKVIEAIVTEILFGAVDTRILDDPDSISAFDVDVADVHIEGDQYQWRVEFTDRSTTLPDALSRKINEAADLNIASGDDEVTEAVVERARGLSLVQRLARNLGARIEINTIDGEQGNVITLYLPLTAQDIDAVNDASTAT